MSAAPKSATLGLWALTALVIGNMIGSGTFLLPSALAPYGLYSLYGWALSLVGAVALALVFARLAQLYPGSGGPQVYARAAFGDGAGFVVAWCYWVSSWCGVAAIAVAFAGNVGPLLPELASSPARSAITAAMAIALCLVCNLSGLKAASLVQSVTAALKLLPLLLLAPPDAACDDDDDDDESLLCSSVSRR